MSDACIEAFDFPATAIAFDASPGPVKVRGPFLAPSSAVAQTVVFPPGAILVAFKLASLHRRWLVQRLRVV